MRDTKKCKICKEEKELSGYYISKETGRHKNVCKKCCIAGRRIDRTSGLKTCKHCGEEKPYSEFQKAGGGKWLQPYCKPCDSKRKKVHHLQNIEEITERRKEYYEANKEIISERARKANQKTKAERAAKAKARVVLSKSLKNILNLFLRKVCRGKNTWMAAFTLTILSLVNILI